MAARPARPVLGHISFGVADLERNFQKLGKFESAALERLRKRGKLADPNEVFEEQMTFGSRVIPIRSGTWPPPVPST